MRKKSTRLLSAALAVCMMLSVLPVGAFAAEPGAAEPENGVSAQADPVDSEFVEINDTNFPDPVFLQYVKDNIDTADTTSGQKDGRLSKAERDAVTEISITNTDCTDLTGIAYFANLTTLECQHNGLKELNLEYNKNLTDLNCSYNQLTTLDVSKNAKLSALRCYNNGMVELNLGDITQLTVLQCEDNNLTELDVSKNPYLKELQCGENKLRRVVIGKKYSLTGLYLRGNQLTSLDLSGITGKILNLDDIWQRYAIDVNEDGTFDLSSLPEGFDVDKTSGWVDGTPNKNILKVYSHRVRYLYNTGSTYTYNHQNRMTVILVVNQHKYQWQHNDTEHWRRCELSDCPGLTAEQVAKTTHDYADAKDNDCNTCGYVRPLYTVTTVNATAKLEDKVLDAPVAAGTEVILTAGNAPEGKTFAGWKLYNVSDTESEITDETELANLLKNGTETTATLTMPAYNVKAEPYYSNIPYNIKAENCTVDKTEAAKGDTVTATRRALKANERFTGWTVKVNGVEQDTDTFLKPDANDPAKVSFVMPAENVEIKANFASNPTLNPTLRVGDHVTATIEGSDASVPSGSTVPVPKNKIVHLTATAPGQHFISWTVKVNGVEQDPTFLKPDADDPTKVTFTMPDANVEVTATFAEDPIPEPDPVGPSDTGNIQGAISAVVVGAAAGAIIYEAGTGIYRVINMPGIPMPSNRIELAELLWEHAGKPEPVSTALYSDIDEGDIDAQKAARWAVEQDLMKDDADNNKFHPAFPVSKLRTCLTWNAAKEKGLFDKTEE
ncbi:MAG: InlB B-repeat-containing protein [Faecalibacterium sp.]